MAYDTIEMEKELLKIIKNNKIVFMDHAFGYTTFSRATGYNHNLDKLDTIKEAININKVKAKNKLIAKWLESDNATLNISAYRLLSDAEEHKKLNQSYIDHSTKGESINKIERVIIDNETSNKDA